MNNEYHTGILIDVAIPGDATIVSKKLDLCMYSVTAEKCKSYS